MHAREEGRPNADLHLCLHEAWGCQRCNDRACPGSGQGESSSTEPTETLAVCSRYSALRIYEIFDHNKQALQDRFRDHAMRIMKKYDFNIVAMWQAKNGARTEFVYLLEWSGEATMKDRCTKLMADQEWKDIKKETAAKYGNLVGEIQDRTLRMTDYSPRGKLVGRIGLEPITN